MGTMLGLLGETIAAGLKKRSVVSCSDWANKYRVMGKPFPGKFSFRHHPWLREMHDAECDIIVGMKAAQMGFTEYALNTAFYYIDIKRIDTLYILPSKTPDASDFSAARFDAALELSPHLSNLFSSVKNVGHKRAGNTNLYIRGSHSKSSLKSIPAGLLILDELEEMDQENIRLVMERQSGQTEKKNLLISTPRTAGRGIHSHYVNTTQEHFLFRCPKCNRYTELTFPECLIITAEAVTDPSLEQSYIVCKECKNRLEHELKPEWLSTGRWVPSYAKRIDRGFHINQLYSPTVKPWEVAKLYLLAQYDKSAEQEFHNSKMGQVHEVKGARVTDDDISNCIGGHTSDAMPKPGKLVTMGADQGGVIHYEINEWNFPRDYIPTTDINEMAIPRVLKAGTCKEFEELDTLMKHYRIHAAVIDAQPEKREALRFAGKFYGFVHLCYYGEGSSGRTLREWTEEPAVTVDRTAWLDLSLGRFRGGRIILPKDLPLDYRHHIKAPVRTYRVDRNGNDVGVYEVADSAHDHYAHARNYSEIALNFAVQFMQPQDMKSPR